MCSRLALDRYGRPVAIVTTPDVGLHVGQTFRVLGNTFESAGTGVGFLGARTGRLPDARTRAGVRAPYSLKSARRTRQAERPPDELLDAPTAIQLARLSQQHEPPDLLQPRA